MFVAYPIGALLAAGLSAVELLSSLKTRPTASEGAWRWWATRLSFEAGVGIVATIALAKIAKDWNPILLGLAAGASASAVLRQRFATLGENSTPVGIALAYDYFRNFFDEQIERCGSENDSKWLNDEVVPALLEAGVTADQVGQRLVDYVAGLGHMGDAQRIEEQAAIERVLAETGVTEEEKIKLLVRIGHRLKAFKTLENLCEAAQNQNDSP